MLLLSIILYDLLFKYYKYLWREHEKGWQKALATVNIKTSIFNLQYLSHFCMDFYAIKLTFLMIYYTYKLHTFRDIVEKV